MKLLVLGGTADARAVVDQLYQPLHKLGVEIIYSLAGLVRIPDMPCQVITGGFRQLGGLEVFIRNHQIAAVLDVTHPYAATMSTTSVHAARALNIPSWRFHRLPWRAQAGDNWREYSDWPLLLASLQDKRSIFLTAGQIDESALSAFSQLGSLYGQQQWLRTAVKPKLTLPESMHWHKAIGPFALEAELAFMRLHHIDALITKNSGGDATAAKLTAARQLNVPVFMLQRPPMVTADETFCDRLACAEFVLHWFNSKIRATDLH